MTTKKMSVEEQRALWCVCDTVEDGSCNYCAYDADNSYFALFAKQIEDGRRADRILNDARENVLNDIYDGVRRYEYIEF